MTAAVTHDDARRRARGIDGAGDAVVRYAKESGTRFEDDVKVAYCPIVNKRWLQKGHTIENPFYGRAMSDCGRVDAQAAGGPK